MEGQSHCGDTKEKVGEMRGRRETKSVHRVSLTQYSMNLRVFLLTVLDRGDVMAWQSFRLLRVD
jgi:hypothetical protein